MNRIQANLPRINLQFDTVARYLDNLNHTFLTLRKQQTKEQIEIAITGASNRQLNPKQFRQYFLKLGLSGKYDPDTGVLVVKKHGKDKEIEKKKPAKHPEGVELKLDSSKLSNLSELTKGIFEFYERTKHQFSNYLQPNGDRVYSLVGRGRLGDIDAAYLKTHRPYQDFQRNLPIHKHRHEILSRLQNYQSLVISGSTGSGKSTQVPQYLLENHERLELTRALVLQPRRISAISLAKRVSEEVGDPLGNLIGYQVKNGSNVSGRTRIFFATTGVLLRRLISSPDLREFSHIVIDEIHERSTEVDLALSAVKAIMVHRPDLKLIVMSATLDDQVFQNYLSRLHPAPSLHIQGKLFPVRVIPLEQILDRHQLPVDPALIVSPVRNRNPNENSKPKVQIDGTEFTRIFNRMLGIYPNLNSETCRSLAYLENWLDPSKDRPMLEYEVKLIVFLVTYILESMWVHNPGSILIFLPGWSEIMTVKRRLEEDDYISRTNAKIIPLHSRLPIEEQNQVFEKIPNQVKIILSTNIAETGVTIDDVVYVIDGGKVRESGYDTANDVETLVIKAHNQASALQRQGRAGRVMPGFCFRLYPSHYFDQLPLNATPEIHRSNLQQLVLQVVALCQASPIFHSCYQFLSSMVDPPPKSAVDIAIRKLIFLKMIEPTNSQQQLRLTRIGAKLAQLPASIADSKLLALAALTNCLDPALTLVAGSESNLFLAPSDPQVAENQALLRKDLGNRINSDLLVTIRSFYLAQGYRFDYRFCDDHGLSRSTLIWTAKSKEHLQANLDQLKLPTLPHPLNSLSDSRDVKDPFQDDDLVLKFKALLTSCQTFNLARPRHLNSPKHTFRKLKLLDGNKAGLKEDTTLKYQPDSNQLGLHHVWFLYTQLFARNTSKNSPPELSNPTVVDSLTLLLFYLGKVTLEPLPNPPQPFYFENQLNLIHHFNNSQPDRSPTPNHHFPDPHRVPGKLSIHFEDQTIQFLTLTHHQAKTILDIRTSIHLLLETYLELDSIDQDSRSQFLHVKDQFFNRIFNLLKV